MKDLKKTFKAAEKTKDEDYIHDVGMSIVNLQGHIDSLNKEMTINLNKIDNNKLATKEIIETMKIQDMTMAQLNQRLAIYNSQLKNTSANLSPETYNELVAKIKELSDFKGKLINRDKEFIASLEVQDMTMTQLRIRAGQLREQLENTSLSADPKKYKELEQELERVNKRMGEVERGNKTLLQKFATMHNPVGSAAKAVLGFGDAIKTAFQTNPVLAIITLLVTVFYKLKDALFGNAEAMGSLNRIMAPFKALFDAFVKVLQEAVVWVLKFVEGFLNGLSKLIERVPFLNKLLGGMNEKAKEAVQYEKDKQALARKHRENLVENAKKENEIAKLRYEATQKDKHGAKERIELLKEAIRLEDEIVTTKIEEAKETLRLLEIEAARTKNTSEMNNKLAEQKALIIGLETEFYNKTKRDQKAISSAILETQREAADAAQKALDKRLQDEENALNRQINALKQARLQGMITEKEYNKQVEQLTIDSLNRKINIKGQEKDKILQLEAQILDAQIKQQTEADKELLEALTKDKDQKLKDLDKLKNDELEILQEQETDQKIYALRAAEIEAQFAQARLDTVRAFGESVEAAEFANAKLREDAIEQANKEILKSQEENLKEQERLRKLFARTTAEFDRLYNIRTWEQRKKDELRILEKQHEMGLLSEETYQLALIALKKKYEDEKLKVRQQYGIASMKELYNAEMELLLEQHEKGLLEEDEYQRALLNLKLKYAQEYADKVGEFTKIASDTVKSFAEAETATLSAEYTKRQADLTEQYNQGILSQEAYNAQKEQLDYEEKSKELELQKKYADVNFAMQASEIISSGAVAAINAYKAMAGIPYVGPALGAVAAALVAVTTGMRLKQAKAERDRVKAMTLESPGGGSGGAPRTGEIRVRGGFAEGGYNMSVGGYTTPGDKYEIAGYLPVHGGEYVIAQEELQQPQIMNMARSIERERRKRTNKNAVPGFADGGNNTPDGFDSAAIGANGRVMSRMLAILERLETGDITVQTNYGITEMEAEQKRKVESESKFTRK